MIAMNAGAVRFVCNRLAAKDREKYQKERFAVSFAILLINGDLALHSGLTTYQGNPPLNGGSPYAGPM